MQTKKIIAFSMIALGGADLMLGTTATPLPIVGDYLTQQLDMVLIGIGVALLVLF